LKRSNDYEEVKNMRRKTVKKIGALLLAVLMVLSVFAACDNGGGTSSGTESTPAVSSGTESSSAEEVESSGTDVGSSDETYNITMAYIGSEQPNQEKVFQGINDLMLEDINMTFETIMMGWGEYQDKLNLMLSGGDKLDILPVYFQYANSYINAGQIVDLNDYIYDYGKDILELMTEEVATSGAVNGFVYGIPSNKESASLAGIVMRKDIVDELEIDVDSISTYDDLAPIFEKVKAAHPEMDVINGTNLVDQILTWDKLIDSFGVLLNDGQDTEVVNWFETDEYNSRVKRINEWYKAGYIKLDAATTTETSSNLVKAGSLFSYISTIKPGFLVQENAVCGREMVTTYLGDDDGNPLNDLMSNAINFFNWGIAQQSEDKVKAAQFLNYAYTSPEWNNLMNFGLEGEDYVRVEGSDTVIDYPEGKDSSSTYHLNMGWMLPNQYIGYVWNGQPEDVWQQYQDFNNEATKSKALGFMYDASSVATEITALNSVLSEYQKPLETGSVSDVEATLKEFNDKLYAAGLQKIMDLKQEQLDAWLAQQ